MTDNIGNKRINEIIDENYVHASVLFFFGISFYNYSDKTLEQVCMEKGLDVNTVIKSLESTSEKPKDILALSNYPVDVIIEYLKRTHHVFVKQKLPYIAKLISHLKSATADKTVKDLKFIFSFPSGCHTYFINIKLCE
jgi:regulator of cell morphogenesis and NO signaling